VDPPAQVNDLTQRLTKVSNGKTLADEQCRGLEYRASSLDTELRDTKTSLEARQKELAEVKDKVSSAQFVLKSTWLMVVMNGI